MKSTKMGKDLFTIPEYEEISGDEVDWDDLLLESSVYFTPTELPPALPRGRASKSILKKAPSPRKRGKRVTFGLPDPDNLPDISESITIGSKPRKPHFPVRPIPEKYQEPPRHPNLQGLPTTAKPVRVPLCQAMSIYKEVELKPRKPSTTARPVPIKFRFEPEEYLEPPRHPDQRNQATSSKPIRITLSQALSIYRPVEMKPRNPNFTPQPAPKINLRFEPEEYWL